MDAESGNLQNEFFNNARRERKIVTIFLGNGKKLTGRIKSFDKFTLLLENHQGELMIFKHAVSTVSATRWSPDPGDDKRAPGARAVPVRRED